jgi:hypothetical protein
MEVWKMKRNWVGGVVALVLVGLLTGCGSDPADPLGIGNGDPAVEQMADVALESDLLTAEMLSLEADSASAAMAATADDGGPSGLVIEERTFRRTQPCPLGGQITVEGSMTREFDRATRVMEIESNGSRTRTDCAFPQGEMVVTVNSLDAFEEHRRRLAGQPDGLQTSRYYGSIDLVRSDGEEHFCEYDYTIVRDPETQTRTIEGTICGGRVRKGVPWRPRP